MIALLGELFAGAVALGALVGGLGAMSNSFMTGLIALITGGIFAAIVFLLAKLSKEAALMLVDIADSTVEANSHANLPTKIAGRQAGASKDSGKPVRARRVFNRPLHIDTIFIVAISCVPVDDAAELLPLPPVTFHILLALVDQERHGYAIIQEVVAAHGGELPSAPARSTARFTACSNRASSSNGRAPGPEDDDERRRYYRITKFGIEVAKAESRRLEQLVNSPAGAASHQGGPDAALPGAAAPVSSLVSRGIRRRDVPGIRVTTPRRTRAGGLVEAVADVLTNATRVHASFLTQDLRWTARTLWKSPGFA